jgi:hypothetical protein
VIPVAESPFEGTEQFRLQKYDLSHELLPTDTITFSEFISQNAEASAILLLY